MEGQLLLGQCTPVHGVGFDPESQHAQSTKENVVMSDIVTVVQRRQCWSGRPMCCSVRKGINASHNPTPHINAS